MTATKQSATAFEEIIERGRRENAQKLAQQIFGKSRRESGSGAGQGPRKPGSGPSLASRIGISKRSVSQSSQTSTTNRQNLPKSVTKLPGNVNADWTHDLHDSITPASMRGTRRNNRGRGVDREGRLEKVLNGSASSPALASQFNIVSNTKGSGGISIRGLAGPATVMAENFAPGTSAADIESAMTPVGGPMLKCNVSTFGPTVTAELVFESREGADNVIDQFHDQIADGRVLRIYHKPGPVPTKALAARSAPAPFAPPSGPRADVGSGSLIDTRSSTRYGASDHYAPRNRSRERRRSPERDDVVDGSYGFEERMDTDEPEQTANNGRLYSDGLVNKREDRSDRGRGWQDDRDRGRRGGRGRDRGRGYR